MTTSRLGLGDRPADGRRVQAVDHDGLGAKLAQQRGLARAPGRRRDLVSLRCELRQQLLPDRSGRSGHEDSHRLLLSGSARPLWAWPYSQTRYGSCP